jgi:hypothetical protein
MKDILRFLFKGEKAPEISIRRVDVSEGEAGASGSDPVNRARLVMFLSYVLAAVLLLCLAGVLVLTYQGKDVPEFIPPTITGIIGYFGGAILAYLGVK